MKREALIAMLSMFSIVAGASAQTEPVVIDRVYDVADLIAAGSIAPTPVDPNAKETVAAIRQPSAEGLMGLIEDVVDPSSWKDNGGMTGGIAFYGTQMIVAQTAAAQEQIAKLLADVRAARGAVSMVSIRAYWLTLTPQEVAQLYGGVPAGGVVALPTVPDSWLLPPRLYALAQGIGFSGRPHALAAARESDYIKQLTPIVGTNAVGYQSELATARSGTSLTITPHLQHDAKSCLIQLQGKVEEKIVAPTTQSANEITPLPGRPQGLVQEINSVVAVPLSRCVLIGGTTVDSTPGEGSTRTIFLAVTVEALAP